MALYWPPVSTPYNSHPQTAESGRRGAGSAGPGSVAAPPAPPGPAPGALPRPGQFRVVPPPPGPQASIASYANGQLGQIYVRHPPQSDPRPPDRPLSIGAARIVRPAFNMYPNDGSVQVIGGVAAPPAAIIGHPAGPLSIPPHEPSQHVVKKPRTHPQEATAPLIIDTRESAKEPGYQPQVEAISPTPEDRPAERDDVKSTKDDLLQKISKVDREIAKAESQIAKLKKKQEELEDSANKPVNESGGEEEKPIQSIAQMVYTENRRKAAQSHAELHKLSAGNELPLYNQPSDTEIYKINKKNYTVFKKKLVEYFKKQNDVGDARDKYIAFTYSKLMSAWNKKLEKVENSKKRRDKEAKAREMYEKMFPELKKQREDKERDNRLGTRGTVRSDQDLQDVMDRLQEQEMEEKKMHSLAVIPPPLLPPEERKKKYINTNGLMRDPIKVYEQQKLINMWTEAEKEIFREKYLQHPKNFSMIAQSLERKSVSDCVQYYYLSKKTENYKQRKSRKRETRRPRHNNTQGDVIAPNVTSRVVTRRTVQELQEKDAGENSKGNSRSNTPLPLIKQEENGDGDKDMGKGRKERGGARDKKGEDSSDDDDAAPAVKCGPHPCAVCKVTVDRSRPLQRQQAAQFAIKEEDIDENSRICNTCWCKALSTKHARCPLLSCSTSSKKKQLRHMPGRWLELSQAAKASVMADLQIPEGTKRVCMTCFGRISKKINQLDESGAFNEPAASAANPTGSISAASSSKDTGASAKHSAEVNTTASSTGNSVAAAATSRSTPGTAGPTAQSEVGGDDAFGWPESEVERVRQSLRSHGTDWAKMAELVGAGKTAEQCKQFFYNHRKKLHLDRIVREYKKANRASEGGDKPSLTSDEESGSSTSSCEEENRSATKDKGATQVAATEAAAVPTSVATAAQAAPKPDQPSTAPGKKAEEGYDSAATISADETGDLERQNAAAAIRMTAGVGSGAGIGMPAIVSTAGNPTVASNIVHFPTTAAVAVSLGAVGGHLPMTVSAATAHMMVAGGTKTIYVKDLMKSVIEQSLQPGAAGAAGSNGSSAGPAGVGKTVAAPAASGSSNNGEMNIKILLQDAAPAPSHPNFVRTALGLQNNKDLEVRPVGPIAGGSVPVSTVNLLQAQAAASIAPTIAGGATVVPTGIIYNNSSLTTAVTTTASNAPQIKIQQQPLPAPPTADDGGALNLSTTPRKEKALTTPLTQIISSGSVSISLSASGSSAPQAHQQQPSTAGDPSAAGNFRPTALLHDYRDGSLAQSRGKMPPDAHGGKALRTTHKELMDLQKTTSRYKHHNDTWPPTYNSSMVFRQDPRKELQAKQQTPGGSSTAVAGHNATGSAMANSTASSSHGGLPPGSMGSITRGQPIPQMVAQQAQHQASQHRYEHIKHPHVGQKGSLTSGTPVYTERGAGGSRSSFQSPAGSASGAVVNDLMAKKPPAPYPSPYGSRPPSQESSRGTSSRSVIENDYKIAQTLPSSRKSDADDIRHGYNHRALEIQRHGAPPVSQLSNRSSGGPGPGGADVHIIDSRYADVHRASSNYGGSRVQNPYGSREPIRGDPRADIPPRAGSSGSDPRASVSTAGVMPDPRDVIRVDYRGDPRVIAAGIDPRDARTLDPRAAGGRGVPSYHNYDSRGSALPGSSQSVGGAGLSRGDPGRRSPPTSRSSVHTSISSRTGGGQPHPSRPVGGSITSGLPRSTELQYAGRGGQPEVSITKQPVSVASGIPASLAPLVGRPEYTGLSNLADIALQQPKLNEGVSVGDHRLNLAAALNVSRTMPGDVGRLSSADPRVSAAALMPPVSVSGMKMDARRFEEQMALLRGVDERLLPFAGRIPLMSEQDKIKYVEAAKQHHLQQQVLSAAARGSVGASSSSSADPQPPATSGFTTANLIDLIVTNQINNSNSAVSGATSSQANFPFPSAAAAAAARQSPQMADGGKDSPNKQRPPSRPNNKGLPQTIDVTDKDALAAQAAAVTNLMRTSPATGVTPVSLAAFAGASAEHMENLMSKEAQNRTGSSPYGLPPGGSNDPHDNWKRRYASSSQDASSYGMGRPPSQGGSSSGGAAGRPPSSGQQQLGDERQIIRVAQESSSQPHDPKLSSGGPPSGGRPATEPISPPSTHVIGADGRGGPQGAPTTGPPYFYPTDMMRVLAQYHQQHRKGGPPTELDAPLASLIPKGHPPTGGIDLMKHVQDKIAEVMKNDGKSGGGPVGPPGIDKGMIAASMSTSGPQHPPMSSSMGPPSKRGLDDLRGGAGDGHSSAGGAGMSSSESPRKRYKPDDTSGQQGPGGSIHLGAPNSGNDMPDSPGSPEMVIDESPAPRPDSAHSHKTASPAPHMAAANLAGSMDPQFRQQHPGPVSTPSRTSPNSVNLGVGGGSRSSTSTPSGHPSVTGGANPLPGGGAGGPRYEQVSDED